MFGRERIEYKTPEQVLLMRRAGLVVAEALAAVRERAVPGVTTGQLDAVAAEVIGDHDAKASFLGYHGYPATLCVSVNDEVVHGIPGPRVLEAGDVVSIDCGAIVEGWHGDSAITVVLDGAAPDDVDLAATTERAMWSGIAALAGAERLGAVGEAVEDVVDAAEEAGLNGGARYGLVEEYVGHGIGTAMHQPPDVPNFRSRDRGPRVRPGLCVAVEPMIVRGQRFTQILDDDWTVVTSDGSRASHWEHTVAVLEDGIWVLTAADGGVEQLGALGVTVAPLG
ncbi:type I methionyl aminopeptidase [Cellulomonas xylanilytica]|uniref:Methionine aminopeptidase n=1 Tax=Cellulomonas xylanilytica TaxID=233583 RepID=A0A510V870_9CELL|nr:type I methionyl aminopeptidase [Cellulomonas xylanilytica]GEK22161.1 methionine aminopeptidase [Cellulomonas xylanilytica]